MLNQFAKYINQHQLFTREDRVLLAVSGGMDSVVMSELFHLAEFKFGIAHCNFKLRANESDADQAFVEQLAKRYKVPFYTVDFETEDYASSHKISTQMAARDLRYQWFQDLCEEFEYNYVAAAHHRDDQVETLFINLIRGTGISGLHGILPKQKNLIRPLLDLSRKQIEAYVIHNKLKYREDSSNASDKYLRNKIRHHLVPVLEDLSDNYLDTINSNISKFRDAELVYLQQIALAKKEIYTKQGDLSKISIPKLKTFKPEATYLYELLKDFGFSFNVTEDIIQSLDNISGKRFFSDTHELLKDRDYLLIRSLIKKVEDEEVLIQEDEDGIDVPIKLKLSRIENSKNLKISKLSHKVQLDLEKIEFPLQLRKWKRGDYFYPFGCTYKKKLSDYFIDNKLSQFEKEAVYLICSGDAIIWIVNHQIDNRFRIQSKSKQILKIEFVKE